MDFPEMNIVFVIVPMDDIPAPNQDTIRLTLYAKFRELVWTTLWSSLLPEIQHVVLGRLVQEFPEEWQELPLRTCRRQRTLVEITRTLIEQIAEPRMVKTFAVFWNTVQHFFAAPLEKNKAFVPVFRGKLDFSAQLAVKNQSSGGNDFEVTIRFIEQPVRVNGALEVGLCQAAHGSP